MGVIINYLIGIYKKYGTFFQGKIFNTVIMFYKYSRTERNIVHSIMYALRAFPKIKVYSSKNKAKAIRKLLEHVDIDLTGSDNFVYSIDVFKSLRLKGKILGNCTIDYRKVVYGSLSDLYMDTQSDFAVQNNQVVDAIIQYVDRLRGEVEKSNIANRENICRYFADFKNKGAANIEEALQRILLINQLQWQFGHILVGLGRLDFVLDELLDKDADPDYLKTRIAEFCRHLHKYYYVKSNALMGDTGQIIILGGNQPDGSYFYNKLTALFMEVTAESGLPDPKILLRVGKSMPQEFWTRLTIGMTSNVGSPLISNDDIVIDKLIRFGYAPEDAYNYITSACWEPIPGESFEQNNIVSLNFLEPFNIISDQGKLEEIDSFEVLMQRYFSALKVHVENITGYLSTIKWEQDPLYSMFNDTCRKTETDASTGGCRYNNYGILTVALSNAVNALLNIREFVFRKGTYTYKELDDMRKNNFKGNELVRLQLKNHDKNFGKDDAEVIDFVNSIIRKTEEYCRDYRNPLGGKLKFGLSSPHYIMNSTSFPASFDGRKAKEPFGVHISADNGIPYTELMNFAARLDYSGIKFNGNVVDFMVSPGFVSGNVEKFTTFLKTSIENGVYQMQANVIDSKTLIAAKANPDAFPNLIVRVWGFNAYFRELPVEYQDYLIERALQSERAA